MSPETDWPFDADRDDPLVTLRIPVTSTFPRWRYVATFDRESAARPTDAEALMIASHIEHYLKHWFNDSYQRQLAERPLDVDSGCNTTIFRKYGSDDWAYRLDSWQYGPMFVPEPPRMRRPGTPDKSLGPLSLPRLLDRIHTVADDKPMEHWLDWKVQHPDIFPAA
ncbi:hypothetical protein ACFXDE_01710 [Kitasatospora sp. NPDC059408]|uniref:hypothetical protein n=1 Tax=Kitasatospora sp. NPDC059408 TaxID=3346823 RepID=UPI0036AA844B